MNKHKHTPGPWAWNGKDMPFADVEDARGNVIAGMNECVRHDDQQARAEERANARLVAAAPELLAAVRGLLDDRCRRSGKYRKAAYRYAEDVLRAAEGEG